MKRPATLLSFAGFLIATLLCATLWRATQKLKIENQSLRAAINELNSQPPTKSPEPDPARLAEFESQKTELLRLRNEVAQLRSARETTRDAEAELARLRATSNSNSPATQSITGQSIPSGDWKFTGFQTPESSLISGLWAMKEGQLPYLLDTFTPAERERFESQMQGKSEAQIAQRFQKEFGKVTGLRVLAQHQIDTDEIVLDVYLEGIAKLKKYRMNQVNNEWKAGAPIDQNFNPSADPPVDPMAYYTSNPELMKRYFPQLYEQFQKQGKLPKSPSLE